MKKRRLRRAGVVTMVVLATTIPGMGAAEAELPQREPRQIIAILIGLVKDHHEFSGEVESKHDINKCVSNVPVQIIRKNADGTWSKVATGDTNGAGRFSIEIPNEAGTYRAAVRRLKVDWGDGVVKCLGARSEQLIFSDVIVSS